MLQLSVLSFCFWPFQQTAGLRSDQSFDGKGDGDLLLDKTFGEGESFLKKSLFLCFVCLLVCFPFLRPGGGEPRMKSI